MTFDEPAPYQILLVIIDYRSNCLFGANGVIRLFQESFEEIPHDAFCPWRITGLWHVSYVTFRPRIIGSLTKVQRRLSEIPSANSLSTAYLLVVHSREH